MGVLDNLINLGGASSTKKSFLSPEFGVDARADFNAPTTTYSPSTSNQTTTSTTDARSSTFAPVDSRQLVLNINSAGATTKKSDKVDVSSQSEPKVSVDPSQSLIPTISTEGSGLPDNLITPTNLLLAGGVVLGGALILRGGKK